VDRTQKLLYSTTPTTWKKFQKHTVLCSEAICDFACKVGCPYFEPFYQPELVQEWKQSDDKFSQYHLATCYLYGEGVPKDENKALELFEKAANQGNAEAQNDLGFLYCMKEDTNKSLHYFQKAADQGNKLAQQNLRLLKETNKCN
jgi:TPR repeat protein